MNAKGTLRMCRVLAFFLTIVLLAVPAAVLADESRVVNHFLNPDQPCELREDVPLLEILFPSIAGCDCAVFRMEDQVMMIDAGSSYMAEHFIIPFLEQLDIRHIDTAFLTHPHDDHVDGFLSMLEKGFTFSTFYYCQKPDVSFRLSRAVSRMEKSGAQVRQLMEGDTFTFGEASVTVIERRRSDFTLNDLSGLTLIEYGKCRYLGTGDVENRAQIMLTEQVPECGLQADILKHPHHGYARINGDLLGLIDPELVIITGLISEIRQATSFLDRQEVPWIRPWENPIRILCDGEVFLVEPFT